MGGLTSKPSTATQSVTTTNVQKAMSNLPSNPNAQKVGAEMNKNFAPGGVLASHGGRRKTRKHRSRSHRTRKQ
jgi:hypothetical protein